VQRSFQDPHQLVVESKGHAGGNGPSDETYEDYPAELFQMLDQRYLTVVGRRRVAWRDRCGRTAG
jgi:hypothetical protein